MIRISKALPGLSCALLIVSLASRAALGATLIQPGDRVVICGDSITEQKIYSVYIEDYLLMCQPAAPSSVEQIGWSGEALPGLLRRITTDVLPFRPTVATLLYGMNDGGYKPTNPETVATFQRNSVASIKALRDGGVRLVLVGSPGAVDPDRYKTWFITGCTSDGYNQTLFDLGQAAKAAAAQEGAAWVDVHGAMLSAMEKAKAKYGQAYPLAMDGVHPSPNGQIVMAYAFLKAMGLGGDIGRFTVDAVTGAASASEGHRVVGSSPGRVEIESMRYPFCFTDDPASPQSTRAMLDCFPFNEELNRLMLVVHHAPARVKVTWGGQSKVFTAEEVERGVNLAAEYLDNPFSAAFSKVHKAVVAQQEFETPAVKSMLDGLGDWRTAFPEERSRYDEMQASVVQRDLILNERSRDAVKPVRHVVEWEAAP